MFTFTEVCFFLFILFVSESRLHVSSCETENIDENVRQKENSFVNISYPFNITDDSSYSEKFNILFEVCKGNKMASECIFKWRKQSNEIGVTTWSPDQKTVCSGQHRNLSTSLLTFNIQISQPVVHSLSLLKLSITDTETMLKTLRLIRVNVLPLRDAAIIAVDGNEVTGDYLINEGQEVNVICFFEKENFSTTLRLLDKHGQVLKSSENERNISLSFAVRCEDDWPGVVCEGVGSNTNQSVSFLVRCPPKFLDNSTTIVDPAASDTITFRVKAHTGFVDACILTSTSVDDNSIRDVNCTLSGAPPDLVLRLHLHKQNNITKGNWILVLRNEKGSAKTILTFPKDSGYVDYGWDWDLSKSTCSAEKYPEGWGEPFCCSSPFGRFETTGNNSALCLDDTE